MKLPILPINDNDPAIVYSNFTLSDHFFKSIDQAGKKYEEIKYYKHHGKKEFEDIPESAQKEKEDDNDNESVNSDHSYVNEKYDEDYYELLGLKHRELVASQDEIKRAYYKLSLKYHPDKLKQNTSELDKKAGEQIFIKMQLAYECLSDPIKKKRYDAQLPFDETIPDHYTEQKIEKNPINFFRDFEACFERNGVYSKETPVPIFGKADTHLEEVIAFYAFWFGFKSWRDFKVDDEYNVEEAENAFEKREMMKENKRMKKQKYKEESQRIQKLVNFAYKIDPRVKRIKDYENEKRIEAKRLDKERIKRENEEYQANMKANMVCLKPISSLTKPEDAYVEKKDDADDFLDGVVFDERWTFEELNQLSKSLKMIPAGTKNRYTVVHKDMIKYGAKKDRKMLESQIREFQLILKNGGNLIEFMKKTAYKPEEKVKKDDKIQNVLNGLDKPKENNWTSEEINLLKEGLKKFSDIKDAKEKFQNISLHIQTKTYAECIKKVKELQNKNKK